MADLTEDARATLARMRRTRDEVQARVSEIHRARQEAIHDRELRDRAFLNKYGYRR